MLTVFFLLLAVFTIILSIMSMRVIDAVFIALFFYFAAPLFLRVVECSKSESTVACIEKTLGDISK